MERGRCHTSFAPPYPCEGTVLEQKSAKPRTRSRGRLPENRLQLGFADRFMRTDGRAVEPALELLDGYFVHDRRRSHLQLETRHGSERTDPVGVTQELQA